MMACSSTAPVEVSTHPIEKPQLVVPKADTLNLRDIEWSVLTPANVDAKFQSLKDSGTPTTYFAVTPTDYGNMALNLNDLRTYISQQQAIIAAYQQYYIVSNQKFDEINTFRGEMK